MGDVNKTQFQDAQGNVYYFHGSADVTYMADGTPVEEAIRTAMENGGFIVSAAAPEQTGKLWIDTAAGGVIKYYNGSSWVSTKAVWG